MTEAEIRAAFPDRPRIYDISMDEWRDVTQDDVARFQIVANAYGQLCYDLERLRDGANIGDIVWQSQQNVRDLCGPK